MPSTSDGRRDPITGQPAGSQTTIETKEFFRTSEFLVLAIAAIGLFITALASGTFGAHDAWPLGALLAATYILSRGVAKMGTPHTFHGRSDVRSIRERVADVVGGEGTIRQREPEPAYDVMERRYATEPVPPPRASSGTEPQQPPYGHPGAPQRDSNRL